MVAEGRVPLRQLVADVIIAGSGMSRVICNRGIIPFLAVRSRKKPQAQTLSYFEPCDDFRLLLCDAKPSSACWRRPTGEY